MTAIPPADVRSDPVPPPAGPPDRDLGRPSRTTRTLVVGAVVLFLIAAGTAVALTTWATPISKSYTATGGSQVTVNVQNAGFEFTPSSDGDVHVELTGWSSGPAPELAVTTSGDTTTIAGGCTGTWFSRCSIDVTVALPASASLSVASTNGRISAADLEGPVTLNTTNGELVLRGLNGELDLRTSNGAIRVDDCASGSVVATTTNGAIELGFREAPDTVEATSNNGGVTVRVPSDESYFVDARTTNGGVNTDAIPSDRFADRTITVSTTNGGITVEPSDR
jgi:hypothetical protein